MILALLAALAWLAAAWVAYRVACWLRSHRTLASLPSPRLGSWLGAHVVDLADPRLHRTMLAWTQDLGGLFLVRAFWVHTVVVSDPLLVHTLLKRRSDADKSALTYDVVNPLFGGLPSLFSASTNSPYWRAVRKGIAPAFNMRSLRTGFQHVQAAGAELAALLHELEPGKVVDIDLLLMHESLDVIGRVGFDVDFGSLKRARRGDGVSIPGTAAPCNVEGAGGDDSDLLRLITLCMAEVNQRWANPLRSVAAYFPGKTGAEVRANEQLWREFQGRMGQLLRTIKERGPPSPDDVSIAAHLLRLEDPISGGPLSDERLLPEIATLFVAGTDTTGHTMAWTLYLVSKHPEVEAKLCEELQGRSLLATRENPTPRQVTFEDIGQLPYLTAVVKESMRLLPVSAGGTAIEFPHDIELNGHTIPAHTIIWVHLFSAQNSSLYWDEPERFDPERFLQPGAEYWQPAGGSPLAGPGRGLSQEGQDDGKDAPGASVGVHSPRSSGGQPLRFFPFSLGTRDCVGQSLARLNYTSTLATLWGQFSFRLGGESAGPGGVRDIVSLTLQPEDGLKMVATPRVPPSS